MHLQHLASRTLHNGPLMSKSQRLRLREVRNVFRLIGECRELGADPNGWWLHLLQGAARLTGAQVGVGGEIRITPDGPQMLRPIDFGWAGERERASFLRYQAENCLASDHLFARFVERLRRAGRVTVRRDQLIPDSEWYRSVHFNEYVRVCGIDHNLVSLHAASQVAPASLSLINVYRSPGERAFDRRSLRLVHLLQRELCPRIGRQLASAREPSAADLAPRARETLQCLLDGDSAKQAASRLRISHETVNQYVKTIYRHFGVNSRGELLALWARRDRC